MTECMQCMHAYVYIGTVRLLAFFSPSNRVGIIGTAPRPGLGGVDDAHDRAVGARHHEKRPRRNHEPAPGDHQVPPRGSVLAPVVVEPHAAHGLEASHRP